VVAGLADGRATGRTFARCGAVPIERHELPNLWAVNFVVHGLLGDGVAAAVRPDAQGKTLGEYLRARVVAVPRELVEG
jgi:hypothetical protein